MKNSITVADYIISFLNQKKVKEVFLITGGAVSFIVDAFSRNKKVKYISVGHEQAAAMMADGYSRLGPNFSATMATSGPGATNLITGIACSWFDSIPSLHICGQVNTYELSNFHKSTKKVRQIGFQETDIVKITKPITKFSYQLKNENEIVHVLEKAYHVACTGRPGPVLIDIPMNFQRKKINFSKSKKYLPNKIKQPKNLNSKIKLMFKLFANSKRPCIILGGGLRISKSVDKMLKFIKKFNIPILTTWSGVDSISHKHKNYIGCLGVYGTRASNFTVQNSDLILSLGTRLDTRITGGSPSSFARNAKVIAVDVDNFELQKKRGLKIDLKINCDLNIFFNKANKNNKYICDRKGWVNTSKKWKIKYPVVKTEYFKQKNYVNPYVFMKKLSNLISKNEVIVSDDGGHLTWTLQGIELNGKQRLFSAFGNSPMGYAFPASIGASIALKKKRVICIDGDGSIQINIQELQTMIKNKLPIKLFILNNNGYGIIKQFQELYLNKRYEASVSSKGVTNPNFKKVAYAYGINYSEIKKHDDIDKKIKKILNSKKPEFVNILIKPDQKIIPKLSFGDPIEDLSPHLDRNEFLSNMIVRPVGRNLKINEAN